VWTRRCRALVRFLMVLCLGVAGTLVWQWYGNTALELIGNSFPQFAWLRPQAVAQVQSPPEMVAPNAARYDPPDLEQLKAIALGLAALRQSVDRLAAQSVASQQQMASDIAKLRVGERAIFDKMASPAARSPPGTPAKQRAQAPSAPSVR
jgi:hypothetical protein